MALLLPNRNRLMRLPRGITSYWPLDAANCAFSPSGGQTSPLDIVGNNFGSDAKSMGAVGLPPFDQGGIGYNYDATANTYLTLASNPISGMTGSGIVATLLVWAYYRNFTGNSGARTVAFQDDIIVLSDDGGNWGVAGAVVVESGSVSGEGRHTTNACLIVNKWHRIVITINGGNSTAQVYVDGVAQPMSVASTIGFSYTAGVWGLGCRDNANRFMDGKLAHAMVCKGTVLTATEIADDYYSAFTSDEVMPAMFTAAGGFVGAWARNSNLPVIGTGTY